MTSRLPSRTASPMMYEPTNYLVILSGISNGMNNLSQQTSSILPMNVEADFIKEALDAVSRTQVRAKVIPSQSGDQESPDLT